MKRIIVSLIAVLCLGFLASPPSVQAQTNLYKGTIYHPSYGNIPYYYNASTDYVYFPTFRRGVYLSKYRLPYSVGNRITGWGSLRRGGYVPGNKWYRGGYVRPGILSTYDFIRD